MWRTNPTETHIGEVISGEGIYAVALDGVPISLRTRRLYDDPRTKYRKTLFNNKGWCIVLAERLNRRFKTDRFAAMTLIVGEPITREDD